MSSLPSECQQLLVSGYVLGNLSSAESALFAEMLSENPELRQQVSQMQQALDLTHNPPEISPPASLRDRILATAKEQQANLAPAAAADKSEERVGSTSQSKLPGIMGAIALFTIAILGINNYRLWRTVRVNNGVETAERRTYLLQSESTDRARAELIVDGGGSNATLIANNLPPLPPEQAYALWTVVGKDVPYTTDEKGAILTAVFQVNEAGNFEQQIAVPQPHLEPKTIMKMAITVEDVAAPQAHTGSIFISTQ